MHIQPFPRVILGLLLTTTVFFACGSENTVPAVVPNYRFLQANTCGVAYFQGASEVWSVRNGVLQKLPDGNIELSPGCFRNVVNGKLRMCGWYPC